MTVELTIQQLFNHFPGLFKIRDDVYNQLFVTLGNGYEWHNGELCSIGEEDPTEEELQELQSHLVDGKAFQHNKLSLKAEALYYAKLRAGKSDDPFKRLYEDPVQQLLNSEYYASLPDDVYHLRPRKERWYCYRTWDGAIDFCEDFVALFNIPTDVKPDWAEALAECRQMLVEDGFENIPEARFFDPENE